MNLVEVGGNYDLQLFTAIVRVMHLVYTIFEEENILDTRIRYIYVYK